MAGPFGISPRAGALRTLAVALMLGATVPASAAPDVTQVQAAALEAQIRVVIARVLGPLARLPDRPVQMTAADDHYDVVVPLAAEALDGSGKAQITGIARPLAGGRWVVENIKASSPLRFQSSIMVPDRAGERRAQTRLVYTLDVQGQDGRVTWDPSFTTASNWMTTTTAATLHAEGATLSQDSKSGPSRSTLSLEPVGTDRADLRLDGTLRDYEIDSLIDDSPVHVGMQRIGVNSALTGVSRSRALTLVQVLTGLAQQTGGPPKVAEVTRAVLAALQDFASSYALDETIDGLSVRIQDQVFGMEQVKIGLAAQSDGGLLQAGVEVGMNGLVLPDLPIGPLGAFIPGRVAFHPVVSGLGVPELRRLVQSAADGLEPNPRDIEALFSHGGIRATLESMTVELAGTIFHAEAKLLAMGPSADLVRGTARISAENFDQLVQKVSGTAEAAQILPVLVLARGAGRFSGDRVVWDLSYRDGKFLVNDVDLSAMMGGSAPAIPGSASPAPRATGRNAAPGWGGTEGPAKSGPPRPINPKQAPSWGK